MANTRDTMGEQACFDALIAGALTEFEDDEVYELRKYAFSKCSELESVNLSNCASVGAYAFHNCEKLSSISLPNCAFVDSDAFSGCKRLASVSLPKCTRIGGFVFSGCTALASITLGYDGVVTLLGRAAIPSQFNSGGTGTIYVPTSQLAAYQANSDWSGYNLAAIAE